MSWRRHSVRLPPDQHEQVERIAIQLGKSPYEIVQQCVRFALIAEAAGQDLFVESGAFAEGSAEISSVLEQVLIHLRESRARELNNALDNYEVLSWLRMIGDQHRPDYQTEIQRVMAEKSPRVMAFANTMPEGISQDASED